MKRSLRNTIEIPNSVDSRSEFTYKNKRRKVMNLTTIKVIDVDKPANKKYFLLIIYYYKELNYIMFQEAEHQWRISH